MDPNTTGTPILPSAVRSPHGYILSGKLMLSGIVVLFGIVLLILFLHLYVRWHVIRRHNRRRRRRELLVFTAEDPTALSSSVLTPPRGLDKDILSSISIEIFSEEEDDDVAPPECAVCLNEFVDGEKVRVLPRCGHRFHIDCIDMWFFSHCTCPLCRCAVEAVTSPDPENPAVSDSDPAPPEAAAVSSPDPEVRIEVLGEEPGSTSGQAVKLPGHRRISSIRRFLNGDLRLNRGGEPDLERGESADRPHSPAMPTTPSAE